MAHGLPWPGCLWPFQVRHVEAEGPGVRGLELRGVDGSLDGGDPGEGSEGQKPGGGAEPRAEGSKGRRVEGSKGRSSGAGF